MDKFDGFIGMEESKNVDNINRDIDHAMSTMHNENQSKVKLKNLKVILQRILFSWIEIIDSSTISQNSPIIEQKYKIYSSFNFLPCKIWLKMNFKGNYFIF